ncbi:MAG: DNA repair protein RadC [Candidatus Hydrogenedentota bacterium]|nr:MAG: DNA repair protein RadC [Candidatus Hydrogenedentota bacterium]
MSRKYKTPLIREMPSSERPRERLAKRGASSLKTSELLAILFRTGTRDLNAVELAEKMLSKFGSLTDMARASTEELRSFDGIGFAKAVEIQAAFELARRLATEDSLSRPVIRSAKDVARLMMPEMQSLDREHFKILLLNTKNHVIRIHTVSVGSLNASVVHPRECFRPAIATQAAAMILVHNHPSGDVEPSGEDVSLTRRLMDAGDLIGIKVLDHVIIAGNKHLSLADRGVK